MSDAPTPAPDAAPAVRVISVPSRSHDIHGNDSWLASVKKALDPPFEDDGLRSNQGSFIGRRPHLIDHYKVAELKDQNVHHSTALETKARATVGLGHRNPKIAEALDPLCRVSWQQVIDAAESDREEFGNGYIEVVRDKGGEIVGLFHLAARDVWVYVEQHREQFHYEISDLGSSGVPSINGLRFARFGEREDLISRLDIAADPELVSEIIHLPMNLGKRSAYYGHPDWLAAVPAMELDYCVTQYGFDFFFNGATPDAIISVVGQVLNPDTRAELEQALREHQGPGNRRKMLLINIGGGEAAKIEIHKLALDGQTTGETQPLVEDQAFKIVSAHRVPPLLAGILVPGKLGAANEMSNSIMAFQTLVISHSQKDISTILAKTLGDPEKGVKGLSPDDFLGVGTGDPEPDPTKPPDMMTGMQPTRPKDHKGNGFNTIVEEMDLGKMDTVSRMRTSVAEAGARGRDLSAGVAERGGEIGRRSTANGAKSSRGGSN